MSSASIVGADRERVILCCFRLLPPFTTQFFPDWGALCCVENRGRLLLSWWIQEHKGIWLCHSSSSNNELCHRYPWFLNILCCNKAKKIKKIRQDGLLHCDCMHNLDDSGSRGYPLVMLLWTPAGFHVIHWALLVHSPLLPPYMFMYPCSMCRDHRRS